MREKRVDPGSQSRPPDNGIAIRAWNVLGGLDWTGIPVVAEMFGIEDLELLIYQLVAIRDSQNE